MEGSVVPIFTSIEEKINKSHILNSFMILLHLIEDRTNGIQLINFPSATCELL